MLIYYQSKGAFSRNYLHLGLLIIQKEKMIYSVFLEGGLVLRQLNKRLIMLIPMGSHNLLQSTLNSFRIVTIFTKKALNKKATSIY
jgi:hypothetical protein